MAVMRIPLFVGARTVSGESYALTQLDFKIHGSTKHKKKTTTTHNNKHNKKRTKKGAFRISAFLVALVFSSGVHAFDQEVEGYIKIFYSVMSERADFSDKTFVGLDSLTSAGSCLIDKGYVRLIITKNSKQLFATMYGAAMAGN